MVYFALLRLHCHSSCCPLDNEHQRHVPLSSLALHSAFVTSLFWTLLFQEVLVVLAAARKELLGHSTKANHLEEQWEYSPRSSGWRPKTAWFAKRKKSLEPSTQPRTPIANTHAHEDTACQQTTDSKSYLSTTACEEPDVERLSAGPRAEASTPAPKRGAAASQLEDEGVIEHAVLFFAQFLRSDGNPPPESHTSGNDESSILFFAKFLSSPLLLESESTAAAKSPIMPHRSLSADVPLICELSEDGIACGQVQVGDGLVSVDGETVRSREHGEALLNAASGDVVLQLLVPRTICEVSFFKPSASDRVGITLISDDNGLSVISEVGDGCSSNAAVEPGMELLSINGKSIAGKGHEKATALLSEAAGTMRLQLRRPETRETTLHKPTPAATLGIALSGPSSKTLTI